MENPTGFFQSILDSLSEHIAVIDARARINYVNAPWIKFANENASTYTGDWQTVNYLMVCDASSAAGDTYAPRAAAGLRSIIDMTSDRFQLEYPCCTPTENLWFAMTATPLKWSGEFFVVISHQDITRRKLAEERVRELDVKAV